MKYPTIDDCASFTGDYSDPKGEIEDRVSLLLFEFN